MKIAIIGGTGKEGKGLALWFARAGHEVIIGSRVRDKGAKAAEDLRRSLQADLPISGTENKKAAAESELAILTVPYAGQRSTLEQIRDALRGKVLVTTVVPLSSEKPYRVERPQGISAAEEAQQLLGPETKVVAAFQNVSAHLLQKMPETISCDILVSSDHADAKEIVLKLINGLSLRALDAGPLEMSRVLESITALLVWLNIRYKSQSAGIKITGVKAAEQQEAKLSKMTSEQQDFLRKHKVARLATADRQGRPHVVPICYAFDGQHLYSAIDEKPKRTEGGKLKRARNIRENPSVAVVVDDYDDDWSKLAYVLIRGTAELITEGEEHERAIKLLLDKYPQYARMRLDEKATIVIKITPSRVVSWEAV